VCTQQYTHVYTTVYTRVHNIALGMSFIGLSYAALLGANARSSRDTDKTQWDK